MFGLVLLVVISPVGNPSLRLPLSEGPCAVQDGA